MRQMTLKALTLSLLITLLSIPFCTAAENINLSNMNYDELVSLKDQINLAIWNSAEWEEVTVPQGVWQIGTDIPVGHWEISAADGVYTNIIYGSTLDESGTNISYDSNDRVYEFINSPTYEFYNENEHRTIIDIDMKDGAYVVVDNGSAVFSPYSGKQALGFKNMKKSVPAIEATPVIEYVYITPEPAAETEPVIEYIYITPEPTAVPTPTPVPTAEPTPVIEYVYITPEPAAQTAAVPAEAESYQSLTHDELVTLRDSIDAQIKELERQYAIENGNRIIDLGTDHLALYEKQKMALEPTVKRVVEDAPESTALVWSSSDEAVATVSSSGQITAVASGEAVITCKAEDDEFIFASVAVTVGSRVTALGLTEEVLTLHIVGDEAESHQISAILTPENAACQDVIWTSSDESVATVDENGMITAKNPGKVVIRATSAEEVPKDQKPKTRSCDVTVVQAVESIMLDQTELSIKKGATASLKKTVLPESATNKKVTWESSNKDIATISSEGQITAKACGTCTITCIADDGSGVTAACEVTVYQPVTSLKPEKTSMNAYMGMDPVQVVVAVSPADATNPALSWLSSEESIATVDENGFVTAIAGGSCKIICTTCDGTEKTAEISVLIPSISVEQNNYIVTEKSGLTIPLKYFGKDISALTATSGNKSILTTNLSTSNDDNGNEIGNLKIIPEKTGKTTVTLNDGSGEKNAVKLNIEIAASATYNSTSYPSAPYKDIMRYPKEHDGKTYQIYGKVQQKLTSNSYVFLLVRVGNNHYAVSYYDWAVDASVIEDDYVTIFGTCTGTYSYETVRGDENTIPAITAEKIKIGRKK